MLIPLSAAFVFMLGLLQAPPSNVQALERALEELERAAEVGPGITAEETGGCCSGGAVWRGGDSRSHATIATRQRRRA